MNSAHPDYRTRTTLAGEDRTAIPVQICRESDAFCDLRKAL